MLISGTRLFLGQCRWIERRVSPFQVVMKKLLMLLLFPDPDYFWDSIYRYKDVSPLFGSDEEAADSNIWIPIIFGTV